MTLFALFIAADSLSLSLALSLSLSLSLSLFLYPILHFYRRRVGTSLPDLFGNVNRQYITRPASRRRHGRRKATLSGSAVSRVWLNHPASSEECQPSSGQRPCPNPPVVPWSRPCHTGRHTSPNWGTGRPDSRGCPDFTSCSQHQLTPPTPLTLRNEQHYGWTCVD